MTDIVTFTALGGGKFSCPRLGVHHVLGRRIFLTDGSHVDVDGPHDEILRKLNWSGDE